MHRQQCTPRQGVLLVNLGTPSEPTPKAITQYLKEFLSDQRVIELPRIIWQPILRGIILRTRPKRLQHNYQSIWLDEGSPLFVYSQSLAHQIQQQLGDDYDVQVAMNYGEPNLKNRMHYFSNVESLTVLPLFPQYSATTTASVFDKITTTCQQWRYIPSMHLIHHYYQHPGYIEALAQHIEAYWRQHGQAEVLMMSYHGLPKKYTTKGDPYRQQCTITSRRLADRLGLQDDQWRMTFQSRFGFDEWLKPYTDITLSQMPQQEGIKNVQVICPGFPIDCLETLEEIDQTNRELFINNGGQQFGYIPALNDSALQADYLTQLVLAN